MIKEFNNEPQAKAIAESLGLLITKYRGIYIVSNSKEELLARYNLEYYSRENIFYDRDVFATSGGGYLVISDKNIVNASAIEIPYGLKSCPCMFFGCTSLKVSPVIPEGIKDCSYMFWECTSLEVPPEIPAGVVDCSHMLRICTSLTTPPKIPESVTNCQSMFYGCTSLKTPPLFPENCDTTGALEGTPFKEVKI